MEGTRSSCHGLNYDYNTENQRLLEHCPVCTRGALLDRATADVHRGRAQALWQSVNCDMSQKELWLRTITYCLSYQPCASETLALR